MRWRCFGNVLGQPRDTLDACQSPSGLFWSVAAGWTQVEDRLGVGKCLLTALTCGWPTGAAYMHIRRRLDAWRGWHTRLACGWSARVLHTHIRRRLDEWGGWHTGLAYGWSTRELHTHTSGTHQIHFTYPKQLTLVLWNSNGPPLFVLTWEYSLGPSKRYLYKHFCTPSSENQTTTFRKKFSLNIWIFSRTPTILKFSKSSTLARNAMKF